VAGAYILGNRDSENNWGLVDFQNTASIIIQEMKDLVISTAKGLFYNAGTSVETVMNVFSEDLSMGRGPAK
jgi:hypothetical protein